MASKNKRIPLLYYIKLCASFQIHQWFKLQLRSGNTRVCSGQNRRFLSHVTLKFDRWPSSIWHYFVAIGEFKLELQSRNAQFGSNSTKFLAVWPWNLMDDLKKQQAPLLSNIKLCAPFHHHLWIQTEVTVRKHLSWVLTPVTLTFDLWPWPFAWTSPW